MPKFAVEIKISTRQVVEIPLGDTWNFHRYGILARRDISTRRDFGFTCMKNLIVYMVT